jgi:hypothetical protein
LRYKHSTNPPIHQETITQLLTLTIHYAKISKTTAIGVGLGVLQGNAAGISPPFSREFPKLRTQPKATPRKKRAPVGDFPIYVLSFKIGPWLTRTLNPIHHPQSSN